MENYAQNKKSHSLWKALLKKWFVIVIAFVLFLGGSIIDSYRTYKPTYTASTSIMLKMAVSNDINASSNTNNATLAKKNLPTVKECLTSTKVATVANAYYNSTNEKEGLYNINKGSIRVYYGEKSMIFTLGYSDASEEQAKAKLKAVIESAPMILAAEIEAESVDLVPVQNEYDVSVSSKGTRKIIIGGVVGILIGAGLAMLIYVLDNKVRDKEELEELTQSSVIAFIENE